jgi:hypothetical protein
LVDQNFFSEPFNTEGFPGTKPRWTPVPAAKLGMPPYNRVCQVRGIGGGSAGSGWLYAKDRILTAAHVVAGAASVEVLFAAQGSWLAASIGKIAVGYFGPGGEERKCSADDLALIVPRTDVAIDVGPFGQLGGGLCVAVGFNKGVLVEHAGSGTDVGPFLAHNCDTNNEHSGCPVFAGGVVRAIHVGQFSGSRPYLHPPQSQTQGYLNSAVRLSAALVDALNTVQEE